MNKRLSSFITIIKLVAGFIAFGLLVGYAAFLINTVMAGHNFIEQLESKVIQPMVQTLDIQESSSRLADVEESADRIDFLEVMEIMFPEQADQIGFMLYGKDGEEWVLIRSIGGNSLSDNFKIGGPDLSRLDRTLSRGRMGAMDLFLGRGDTAELWLNVNPDDESFPLVVKLLINRDHLRQLAVDSRYQLLIYTGIMFVVSWILGSIFARRQSRPLRSLGEKATMIAGGDFGIRFPVDRHDEIGQVSRSMNIMAVNLEHRIATMQTMNRIDRAVLDTHSGTELTQRVARYISEQFDGAGVCILEFSDQIGGRILKVVGTAPDKAAFEEIPWDEIPREMRKDLNTQSFLRGACRELLKKLIPPDLVRARGVRIPLFVDGTMAGVVMVSLDEVSDLDWDALSKLTDQVGVALQHQRETEKREALYLGSLKSLTATVDAKSFWTAGHSDRVASLSVFLAEAIGLDNDTIDTVRFGGLLHDIGKISIDETILDKPGRLSEQEYDTIKKHPESGAKIVESIPEFGSIQEIIRHHHERWDGGGYPAGLKHDRSPFLARLVCISDVYEAITADRPYRKGKTPEAAREFMIGQRERIFDPGILDVFIEKFDAGEIPI